MKQLRPPRECVVRIKTTVVVHNTNNTCTRFASLILAVSLLLVMWRGVYGEFYLRRNPNGAPTPPDLGMLPETGATENNATTTRAAVDHEGDPTSKYTTTVNRPGSRALAMQNTTTTTAAAAASLQDMFVDVPRHGAMDAATTDSCHGQRLRFLHVPKTSSTLALYIWHATCFNFTATKLKIKNGLTLFPKLDKCLCYHGGPNKVGVDYHHYYLRDPSIEDAQHSVGMFREPLSRMVSHFNYFYCRPVNPLMPRAWKKLAPDQQLINVANMSKIQSAMSKMLVGKMHDAPDKLTVKNALPLAVQRLRAMPFVGIMECYNESIALFSRTFEYRSPPAPDVKTFREGTHKSDVPHQLALLKEMMARGVVRRDDCELLLYRAAVSLFHQRLRRYNISLQSATCKFDFNVDDYASWPLPPLPSDLFTATSLPPPTTAGVAGESQRLPVEKNLSLDRLRHPHSLAHTNTRVPAARGTQGESR